MHDPKDLLEATTAIAVALAANMSLSPSGNGGGFTIASIYAQLAATATAVELAEESDAKPKREPAVSERKSLASPDHIISMIDGKPYKTLRRHLSTFGYTPESYREEFGLKPSYPMVAPSYSETRRAMAHKIGLGTKGNRGG